MSHGLTKGKKRYFIGANTSRGFINYGGEIFADIKKLYVIKGGPGTGKSTFMKRFAERAEEKGHEAVYYYCSSDPGSLDGVVIPSLGLAVTDGTAPHICEADYPGAKEEYLNFGEFWNGDFLCKCRNKIEKLSKKKSKGFSSAYKYLSIAESVREEREKLLYSCYDEEKAEKAVTRFMKNVGSGTGYLLVPRQISSFGMEGEVVFDTYIELCDKTVYVKDKRGVSTFIFDLILKRASVQGLESHVSYDCFGRINAVMFSEKGVAVVVGDGDKVINTERFVIGDLLSENRRKLRFLRTLEEELKQCALKELESAKESHFLLEDIYREAMDFDDLQKIENAFINKAFE